MSRTTSTTRSSAPTFAATSCRRSWPNRKTRLQTIQAAKKRLAERKAAEVAAKQAVEEEENEKESKSERVLPEPRDQESFSGPDSRIMPTAGRSFEQSCNAQVAVDAKAQIVVAATVSQSSQDMGLLLPVVNAAFESMQ